MQNFILMRTLAKQAHEGQVDKNGVDYMEHVESVVRNVMDYSDDPDVICIAYGHDLIEDTIVTEEYLRNMGFNDRIVSGIVAMTKVKGQSYDEYLEGVMENQDAIKVKMADLRDNTDIRRNAGNTEKDMQRIQKYIGAFNKLRKALEG